MASTMFRPESFRFFLWDYLKDKVHSRSFVSVEDLKERIKLHYSNLNYDQLNSVMKMLRNEVRRIQRQNIRTFFVDILIKI